MNEEYYDSEEQDMWEGPGCPACGNGPKYLGQLGNLHWWKCRACGLEHSTGTHCICGEPHPCEHVYEVSK